MFNHCNGPFFPVGRVHIADFGQSCLILIYPMNYSMIRHFHTNLKTCRLVSKESRTTYKTVGNRGKDVNDFAMHHGPWAANSDQHAKEVVTNR